MDVIGFLSNNAKSIIMLAMSITSIIAFDRVYKDALNPHEPEECLFVIGEVEMWVGNVWRDGDKCCVGESRSYQTKEVCKGGILGIGQSCYEASEPHWESYVGTRCFDLREREP